VKCGESPARHHDLSIQAGLINSMTNLPKVYFRDIPAYVMEEIITGMTEGKPVPTGEEIEEWRLSEMEREAEALLAEYA
jgi:hypothetical protein